MLALVALLLLQAPVASDWPTVLKPTYAQVVRLQIAGPDGSVGTCSGTVINKTDGYVLTAAHCVDEKDIAVTVNTRHAEVIKANRLLDLAVLQFVAKDETEMELAPETPPAGTEVAALGFAFGAEKMGPQIGHIQQYNAEGKDLWVNVDIIFGDSGGPLIDKQGRLVGVNSGIYSIGPAHLGSVIPVDRVVDFVKPYLPKPKPAKTARK